MGKDEEANVERGTKWPKKLDNKKYTNTINERSRKDEEEKTERGTKWLKKLDNTKTLGYNRWKNQQRWWRENTERDIKWPKKLDNRNDERRCQRPKKIDKMGRKHDEFLVSSIEIFISSFVLSLVSKNLNLLKIYISSDMPTSTLLCQQILTTNQNDYIPLQKIMLLYPTLNPIIISTYSVY